MWEYRIFYQDDMFWIGEYYEEDYGYTDSIGVSGDNIDELVEDWEHHEEAFYKPVITIMEDK